MMTSHSHAHVHAHHGHALTTHASSTSATASTNHTSHQHGVGLGANAKRHRTTSIKEDDGHKLQTICAVCKVTSDNHHIHYGALVCFSCRAFFRRAHSKAGDDPSSAPKYVCKKNGNCDVSSKNRKKCQKCRYEKCLAVGMDPKQVLSTEQKKVRFRKMLEKRGSMSFSRKSSSGRAGQGARNPNRSNSQEDSSWDDMSDEENNDNDENDDDNATGNAILDESSGKLITKPTRKNKTSNSRPRSKSDLGTKKGRNRTVSLSSLMHSNYADVSGFNESYLTPQQRQRFFSGGGGAIKIEPSPVELIPSDGPIIDIGGTANDLLESVTKENLVKIENSFDEDKIKMEILSEIGLDNDKPRYGQQDPTVTSENFVSNNQSVMTNYCFPNEQGSPWGNSDSNVRQEMLRNLLDMETALNSQDVTLPEGLEQMDTSLLLNSSAIDLNQQKTPFRDLSVLGKLEAIMEAYSTTVRQVSLESDVMERLIASHRQEASFSQYQSYSCLEENDFCRIASFKTVQFETFASRLSGYTSLSPTDLQILASVKANMWVHFCMASYATSKNGSNQLLWLLPEECVPSGMKFLNTKVEDFVAKSGIVKRTENDVFAYVSLAAQLAELNLNPNQAPLIAAVLLFTLIEENASIDKDAMSEVVQMDLQLRNMVSLSGIGEQLRITEAQLDKLMDIVTVISVHCNTIQNHKIVLTNGDALSGNSSVLLPSSALHSPLSLDFALEEDEWFSDQMRKFSEAYNQVALGEEFIDEFVMFSFDVPLSKKFIPKGISAFVERCRRILMIHPEFSELSDEAQRRIWRDSCFKAAAICSVKSESHNTGAEQLKFCIGSSDKQSFDSKISPLEESKQSTKIKKVLVTDWNRTSNALDTEQLIHYLQLTAKLTSCVHGNLESFVLVALMSLLGGNYARENKGLNLLERKYANLYNRRVIQNGSNGSQLGEMTKIRAGLESVDELGEIFQKLHFF